MKGNIQDLILYVKNNSVEMIDLKFIDLFGQWHHLTIPADQLSEETFTQGVPFDASSTPGFKTTEAGDMVLIPDAETLKGDPFWEVKTLGMTCDVAEADTKLPYPKDPRGIAKRADSFLKSSGIANESLWSPELEFYIFDSVNYQSDINLAQYFIDSVEADWNSGMRSEKNLGHKISRKGGYHAIPPLDVMFDLRTEMVQIIQQSDIQVRYHHHEAGGPGQSEIEILFYPFVKAADYTMWCKYVIKMVAQRHGRTVTFMPKPLYNEAGSGMHIHQRLFREGKPLFFDACGYAGLSQEALYYIGGLLSHAPSLTAFTNPSTNSFKRLVPGFEAPVNLFFSLANRSAAIRIPKYAVAPHEKSIEFRPSDATCNIYIAMSAILMAGIDGISKKIDPTEAGFGPYDLDSERFSKQLSESVQPLPSSLREAMDALEKDYEYLLEGEVFNQYIIDAWIERKMKEYYEVRNRPHPYEMNLYYEA
ncbi:MAG: type I glutamate--ammonia ligase [Acidobacteria bacterium]|nr:type I glutamate--ammonia ligase [Acidobacteriota bacterium]